MNQFAFADPTSEEHFTLDCSDLMSMAQQELTAFFHAVTELFGREQAEVSADDWLNELKRIDVLPVSTREWRSITARVSSRLATRVASLVPAN